MNTKLIITIGFSAAMISCNDSSDLETHSSDQESTEETDTLTEQIYEQTELIIDTDLSSLEGKRYLTLFETSFTEQRVVIEPACLSDCPWVSFEQLDYNKIKFGCGQDAIEHNVSKVSEKNDLITFMLEENLQLEVERLDSNIENPFEHIEISLSDFNSLYLGYYNDSITSLNSERLIMMLNTEQNREYLRNQNRWTAIPCPEDVFD